MIAGFGLGFNYCWYRSRTDKRLGKTAGLGLEAGGFDSQLQHWVILLTG